MTASGMMQTTKTTTTTTSMTAMRLRTATFRSSTRRLGLRRSAATMANPVTIRMTTGIMERRKLCVQLYDQTNASTRHSWTQHSPVLVFFWLIKLRNPRCFVGLWTKVPLTNSLIDWLVDWMTDWLTEWMNKWMNECVNEKNEYVNEWMTEWMTDWMNEWINEPTNEWMNE